MKTMRFRGCFCDAYIEIGPSNSVTGPYWVQHGDNPEARRQFTVEEVRKSRCRLYPPGKLLPEPIADWFEEIHKWEAL